MRELRNSQKFQPKIAVRTAIVAERLPDIGPGFAILPILNLFQFQPRSLLQPVRQKHLFRFLQLIPAALLLLSQSPSPKN